MFLFQVLLPLADNDGHRFGHDVFRLVRRELTERFGGLTAYTRSLAEGLWQDDETSGVSRDEVVIFEVMVEELDRAWWQSYRSTLEARFRQDVIVIRVIGCEMI